MTMRARVIVTVAALQCCIAAFASAHRERYPKRDVLTLERTRVVLSIDYVVPRGELAAGLRRVFDRDRDGELGDKERGQLARHLAREATAFLSLTVDGRAARLTERTAMLDATGGEDERLSLHVELAADAPLDPGDHTLRLADRHKDRRISVPLAVKLTPGITWRVRPPVLLLLDPSRAAMLQIKVSQPE